MERSLLFEMTRKLFTLRAAKIFESKIPDIFVNVVLESEGHRASWSRMTGSWIDRRSSQKGSFVRLSEINVRSRPNRARQISRRDPLARWCTFRPKAKSETNVEMLREKQSAERTMFRIHAGWCTPRRLAVEYVTQNWTKFPKKVSAIEMADRVK